MLFPAGHLVLFLAVAIAVSQSMATQSKALDLSVDSRIFESDR